MLSRGHGGESISAERSRWGAANGDSSAARGPCSVIGPGRHTVHPRGSLARFSNSTSTRRILSRTGPPRVPLLRSVHRVRGSSSAGPRLIESTVRPASSARREPDLSLSADADLFPEHGSGAAAAGSSSSNGSGRRMGSRASSSPRARWRRFSESEQVPGRAAVNVDPGIINDCRIILASTSDHAHRIYRGDGVWEEVTLVSDGGASTRFRGFTRISAPRPITRSFGDSGAELLDRPQIKTSPPRPQ